MKLIRFILGSAALISATGCNYRRGICCVDCCADIPCGTIPPPAGHHVCQWQHAQVGSANQDLFVFYQQEFLGDSAALSPSGEEHMARLAEQDFDPQQPIIVEQSVRSQLDTERVQALSSRFAAVGLPVGQDSIQIAKPAALGLQGQIAEGLLSGGAATTNNRSTRTRSSANQSLGGSF